MKANPRHCGNATGFQVFQSPSSVLMCPTLLLGRLLDCDDQTTSLTLLTVFTGCVHLNASSLHWQSLSTKVFTALHLGICLICYMHRVADVTSRRRLRSSTSSELVIPLSRLVTVGDRPLAVAGPRLWNTFTRGHHICAISFSTKIEKNALISTIFPVRYLVAYLLVSRR